MGTKPNAGLSIISRRGRVVKCSHARDREPEVVIEIRLTQVEGQCKYPDELHGQGQDIVVVLV